ncbi:MAG: hypothetical protein IMZ55_11585, partial [Acidobacteria bacterium]|nr:hypothetical protein [Acidobacteriota bacterium]
EAAGRLVLPGRPTAVFVFQNRLVDVHVFGEPACGRLGPHNYLGAADVERTVGRLAGQCDQVSVVLLDPLNGEMEHLGSAARRTVFMATPDAESAVETYRTLKVWHAAGADAEAALLVVGGADAAGAARMHGRLRRAAKGFLGCDLLVQGYLTSRSAGVSAEPRGGLQILSQAPADRVWPALLDAAGCGAPAPAAAVMTDARADVSAASAPVVVGARLPEALGPAVAGPQPAATASPPPGVCPAFALWHPKDPAELIDAIEAQLPGLLPGSVRQVLRVEVDEPGAPPLAAVRDDGALVAILLPGPDERVDTRAAEAWLRVHRRLLARAYPASGMALDGQTAAMVLAPMDGRPEAVGVRRFVPVRLGGHRGIVLVP